MAADSIEVAPTRENIVTVKAFIREGNALLFIQHENGRWDIPGGRISIPESLLDCLRREVHEEIGVDVTRVDVDHPWVWYWEFRSKSRLLIQNIVGIGYPCELGSDAFQLAPPEHVAHAWVTATQLRALYVHDGHRNGYLRWMELQGIA